MGELAHDMLRESLDAFIDGDDAKATREQPIWYSVDIAFRERFPSVVPLTALKGNSKLSGMLVTKRGVRLSVQPVTAAHFAEVCRMGRQADRGSKGGRLR